MRDHFLLFRTLVVLGTAVAWPIAVVAASAVAMGLTVGGITALVERYRFYEHNERIAQIIQRILEQLLVMRRTQDQAERVLQVVAERSSELSKTFEAFRHAAVSPMQRRVYAERCRGVQQTVDELQVALGQLRAIAALNAEA